MKNVEWKKLILSLLIPQIAGGIGAWATTSKITSWYATLNKPIFSPPNWVFGPAWTVLYLLMGWSLYLVWEKRGNLRWFWVQLGLNTLWSLLFFGLESPAWALVEIIGLWISIGITIMSFRKISGLAADLLIPYWLWVSFAAILNGSVVWLNK